MKLDDRVTQCIYAILTAIKHTKDKDFNDLKLDMMLITTDPETFRKLQIMLGAPIREHIKDYAGEMADIVKELKADGKLIESPTYVSRQIKRFITEGQNVIDLLRQTPCQDSPEPVKTERIETKNEPQTQSNETREIPHRKLPWQ